MKKKTIAVLVKEKTGLYLFAYAKSRGLSKGSLSNGYISLKAKEVLEKDGIRIEASRINFEGRKQ